MSSKRRKEEKTRVPFPLLYQLFTVVAVFSFILFSAFFLIVIPQIRVLEKKDSNNDLRRAAIQVERMVEQILQNSINDANLISAQDLLRNPGISFEQKAAYISDFQNVYQVYDDVVLLDTEGQVLASATYNFRTIWEQSDWFEQVVADKTVVSDVYKIARPAKTVINIFSPVHDYQGQLIYIIVFQIDMNQIWQFTDLVQIGDSGFIYIEDEWGRIIAAPSKENILRFASDLEWPEEYIKQESILQLPFSNSVLEWKIIAAQTPYEFYTLSNLVSNSIALILVIVSILIFVLSAIFVSFKVRTINKFIEVIRKIQSGNLNTNVEVTSLDEFRILADAFNTMIDKIKAARRRLSLIVRNAPLGIYTLNKNGIIDSFNPKMVELSGVNSARDVIGLNALELKSYKEAGLDLYFRQGLKGKSFEVEVEYKSFVGKKKSWRHYRGVPIFSPDGKTVERLLLMVSDITERMNLRRQHEEMIWKLDMLVEERTQELRKSEERCRSILENTGIAICIIEEDTKISFINKSFTEFTGYSKNEVEGKMSWTQFVAPKYKKLMKKYHLARRMTKGTAPSSYDFDFYTKTGKRRSVHLEIAMIPGTRQSVASLIDITDRKTAEEELKKAAENYQNIFEAVNDAIFVLGMKNGKILDVNKRMLQMYGFKKKEEVIGKSIGTLGSGKSPFTSKKLSQWVQKAVKVGPQLFEWHAKNKMGDLFWVEVNLKKVMIAGEERVLAVVRDITERKEVEAELRVSEERYRTTCEASPDCLMFIDVNGVILQANQAAVRIHRFRNAKQMIGKNMTEVIPEVDQKLFRQDMKKAKKGKTVVTEHKISLSGGREKYFLRIYVPVMDEGGKLKNILIVCKDIGKFKTVDKKTTGRRRSTGAKKR